MAQFRNIANPERHRAMHGLRSSSAASPHQDARTKRARTAGDALRSELSLEQGTEFELGMPLYTPHIYEGERCMFCNVNVYDDYIYGPYDCAPREGYIYSTETKATL